MKFIICSKCHALVRPKQTICPLCQHPQSEPAMQYTFCKRDGTPVAIATGFCPTCGSTASIASARTKWVWALTFAFLFTSLLIALPPSFNSLHDALNTTYQPLTCRLNKGYVTTSGSYYTPYFEYDVLSPQGSIIASGSGDMYRGAYSKVDEAQQDLQQYQIGSTYPCWYSSSLLVSTHVMLQPPSLGGSRNVGSWIMSSFICLFLIMLLFVFARLLYPPWRLHKRGIAISGSVIKHEERTDNQLHTRAVSLIEFETKTDPPLRCRTVVLGSYPLDQSIDIFYDPLNPEKNTNVGTELSIRQMVLMNASNYIGFFLGVCVIIFFCWLAIAV